MTAKQSAVEATRKRGSGAWHVFLKKTKYSVPPACRVVFSLLVSLLLALCSSAAAHPPDEPAEPAKQEEDCLVCHGDKDFKDEAGRSLYVDHAKKRESVHGSLGCSDCHTTIKGFPHPERPQPVSCKPVMHAKPKTLKRSNQVF